MSRIRSVKPELFTSTSLARVSRDARYLFIGLFTEADDEGRLLDSPKLLAGAMFPHDEDVDASQVDRWLEELAQVGSINRYEIADFRYIELPAWHDHQRISHPTPSRLPNSSGEVRENFGGEGKGMERKGSNARPSKALGDDFEVVWAEYPRKLAKQRALSAYVVRRRSGIGAEELLTATRHYASHRRGQDPTFTMHASTFFGPGERWRDFLDPASAKPPASGVLAPARTRTEAEMAESRRRAEALEAVGPAAESPRSLDMSTGLATIRKVLDGSNA